MAKILKKPIVFLVFLCMLFTMTPMAVFATEEEMTSKAGETLDGQPAISEVQKNKPTTLTIYYVDKDTVGYKMDIKFVEHEKDYDGEKDGKQVYQGYVLTFEDYFFIGKDTIYYDVTDFVPEWIWDTNGDLWKLFDDGCWDKIVAVKKGKANESTFTYKRVKLPPPPKPTPGSITIKKEVIGDPDTAAVFTFKVTGPGAYVNTVTITGEGSTTISGLAPGTYTITEVDVPSDYTANTPPQSKEVLSGKTAEVTFTNTYKEDQNPPDPPAPTPGGITITKVIQGDPDTAAVFTFKVTGPGAYTTSVAITGEGSTNISDLAPGTYTITEVDVPADYTPSPPFQIAVVSPGGTNVVTFINDYNPEYIPDTPLAYVNKSVALYDGVNMPGEDDYTNNLTLTQLGKKVLYRIQLLCDSLWIYSEKIAGLFDIYRIGSDEKDITDDLLVMTPDGLKKAYENVSGYPGYLQLSNEVPLTFYYIDELSENGTYTNTAYVYEQIYYARAQVSYDEYPEPIASASAIVTVNYNPPDPEPDDDDNDNNNNNDRDRNRDRDSTVYYNVTYNANYPPGFEASGTVPTDAKNYTYNSVVTVKGNTGDMKVADHIFKSWNTKADGTGITYLPGDTFRITSDITLYAQWELAKATTLMMQAVPAPAALALDDLDDVPKTGTAAPLMPMLFLGLSSLAAICILGRKTRGSD